MIKIPGLAHPTALAALLLTATFAFAGCGSDDAGDPGSDAGDRRSGGGGDGP